MTKDYFNIKYNYLYSKGISEGKIVDFDNDFMDKLDNLLFLGIPASIHIKYFGPNHNKNMKLGKCEDRSLMMFIANKDSSYVSANYESYKSKNDKTGYHVWVELENYVYDPTTVKRYDRDLFYKLNLPKNIEKHTWNDINKDNIDYYESVRQIKIEDYLPGGSRRYELFAIIPLVYATAELANDKELLNVLNKYLNRIKYDEIEIKEEMDEKL